MSGGTVRTYNPSVRVGNWNEDIQLEEDSLKDFLERRECGELHIQKKHGLVSFLTQRVDPSISRDGKIHFGDIVQFKCPAAVNRAKPEFGKEPRDMCTLSINITQPGQLGADKVNGPCGVSGGKFDDPCMRNTFVISSIEGNEPDGSPLRFTQSFHLRSSLGGLLLRTDKVTFDSSAKYSRHQEVRFDEVASTLTKWQILSFDPSLRMEHEGTPVPGNEKIILNHVKTNHNLAVEQDHLLRSPFGSEYELSAHTYLDSHKAEEDVNHWLMVVGMPGSEVRPIHN